MNTTAKSFYRKLPDDMEPTLKGQWGRAFLKRDANICGLGVILILAVQLAIGPIFSGLATVLNRVGAYTDIMRQMLTTVEYLFYMGVPFLIVMAISGRAFSSFVSAGKPKPKTMLPVIMIAIGLIPVVQYLSSAIDMMLSLVKLDTYQQVLDVFNPEKNVWAMLLQFFTMAVLAPLFEEFAYRGVVLQMLRRYGNGVAVFGSAFLFGMMHGNTYQIPFAFMLGLLMGLAVVYTGTLWTSILIHFSNNFMSFLISVIADHSKKLSEAQISLVVWGISIAIGLFGIAIFIAFNPPKPNRTLMRESQVPAIRPYKAFFGSPIVILAVVVMGALALLQTNLAHSVMESLKSLL